MKRTACEKCCPRMKVIANAMTATAMNVYLVHLRSLDASFLNFIENIGISLTSKRESANDKSFFMIVVFPYKGILLSDLWQNTILLTLYNKHAALSISTVVR